MIASLAFISLSLAIQENKFDASAQFAAEAMVFREKASYIKQLELSNEEQPDIAPAFIYPAIFGEAQFKAAPTPNLSLTLHGIGRFEPYDKRRRLLDLPVAKIAWGSPSFRTLIGYDIVSWGVMEYVNTTDVLNQNDILEHFLSKRKLGQPMVSFRSITALGTWEAYALSFFRPMPLPGEESRFSPGFWISENPIYGSDAEQYQIEGAIHTSGRAGPLDYSAHYFHGYEREPRFHISSDKNELVQFTGNEDGPYLIPEYRLSHQMGGDALWITGDWIFKTENAFRLYEDGGHSCFSTSFGLERNFTAFTSLLGLENTPMLASLANLPWDATWYLEYLFDTRDASLILPFTNHLFSGLRLSINDAHGSEATLSYIHDFETEIPAAVLGGFHFRAMENFKIELNGVWILPPRSLSPFKPIEQDSHGRIRLILYW
jgi:hypothetical protein